MNVTHLRISPSRLTVPALKPITVPPAVPVTPDQSDQIVIGHRGQRMVRTEFDRLRSHIAARIELFPSGEILPAKVLADVAYWHELKSPTNAGHAIAYMAEHQLLPITRVRGFPGTSAYYRLP